MPVDKSRYPDDWPARARAVKDAAGWVCESCGAGHLSDGTMGTCLTVHHPDHDPENPDARMVALCARCHLAEERAERRRQREAGQGNLFDADPGGYRPEGPRGNIVSTARAGRKSALQPAGPGRLCGGGKKPPYTAPEGAEGG